MITVEKLAEKNVDVGNKNRHPSETFEQSLC